MYKEPRVRRLLLRELSAFVWLVGSVVCGLNFGPHTMNWCGWLYVFGVVIVYLAILLLWPQLPQKKRRSS